jgi:hypothetical protein
MIAESAKAWAGALLPLLWAIGHYAVEHNWETWSMSNWQELLGVLLWTLPQAATSWGIVWAIPNQKPTK